MLTDTHLAVNRVIVKVHFLRSVRSSFACLQFEAMSRLSDLGLLKESPEIINALISLVKVLKDKPEGGDVEGKPRMGKWYAFLQISGG